MKYFYTLSYTQFIFIITLITIAVILNVISLTYEIRTLPAGIFKTISSLYDCALTVQLLLITYILAKIQNYLYCKKYVLIDLTIQRNIIIIVLIILCGIHIIYIGGYSKLISLLFVFSISPVSEELTSYFFPHILSVACIYFIFNSFMSIVQYMKYANNNLSELSVKEAVDTLDFGVLFFKTSASSLGEIILCNNKMHEIMIIMNGKIMYNGQKFYDILSTQNVSNGCFINNIENELVYTLPDNSYWIFEFKPITINGGNYALLTCSDVTTLRSATYDLNEKLTFLKEKNKEISLLMNNIEEICKTNETINMKCYIHSLLGQKISLLLRSVREHIYPDEYLLNYFSEDLFHDIDTEKTSMIYTFDMIKRDFKGLNIKFNTKGELPYNSKISKLLYEVCLEAITNSIRHGYASKVNLLCSESNNEYLLQISDNGIVSGTEIKEGLGLSSMRKKISTVNGSFSYTAETSFKINIKIPKLQIEA